jgi:hypothetical protein
MADIASGAQNRAPARGPHPRPKQCPRAAARNLFCDRLRKRTAAARRKPSHSLFGGRKLPHKWTLLRARKIRERKQCPTAAAPKHAERQVQMKMGSRPHKHFFYVFEEERLRVYGHCFRAWKQKETQNKLWEKRKAG